MSEYHFDGTNIIFRFTILDASGLIRQSGITGTVVTVYDSLKAEDPVTETITEIASTGDYEASIPYSELNRLAAGDGLWTFIPGHTNTDLTFEPKSVHIQISREIGTATGTPSSTVAIFTGLGDLTANHYVDSSIFVVSGNNKGERKRISASADSGGNVQLTFDAMSAPLVAGDKVKIDGIATAGSGVSAAQIADAVWDEAKADHVGATTFGDIATDLNTVAVDVAGLDGAAMRGTDNAALASVCTEGRLAELDAANLPTDVVNVKTDTAAILIDTGTTLDAALAVVDANVDSILVDTAEIGVAGAGLTALGDARLANLDTTVSSRASQASVNTIDDFLDTEIASILLAVDTEVADILTDTGTTIPAQIAALNNLSAAQVNAEVDTAITDARLDELLAADSDIDGVTPPTVGSVFHELMSKTAGSFTFDQTTDSNEAIRDKETDIETDTAEIGVAGAGLTNIAVGVGGIQATSFAAGAIDAASLAADATTEITAGVRIKKNTALSNFMFLMVSSTDHVTPKTGLTITATRSIDGAAFAACANSAAEVANGMYKINLATTDLNGDVITLRFTGTAADARLITIVTTT